MLENNKIWFLITVITLIIEWVSLKKVLDCTSSKKLSNFKINIIFFIIVSCAIKLTLMDIFPNYRILIFILVTIIFYKVSYYEEKFKFILVSLIYWMVLLGSDALSMSSVIWVNSLKDIYILSERNLYTVEAIVFSKLILIILVFLYYKSKIKVDIVKKGIIYTLIPIATNIASFLVIFKYTFEFKHANVIGNNEIITISVLLFLSNISLILTIRKIIIDNRLIAESNIIKEKMKIQYNHYINLQEDQMKVRQLHHDIKNHIACIKSLKLSNNYANEYINNIEKDLNNCDNNFNTGNMILDIILGEKNKTCKENDINFISDINFSRCNFIEIIDICSIFSNMLDNAIEACNKINDENRYIILRGSIVDGFFVIRIENSKINKIKKKNNDIITDKKDSSSHGLGVRIIKSSVRKYNGQVAIDYTENKFIMKIFIPLN